jgi:hypothetical protein
VAEERQKIVEHIQHDRDGTVWAKGPMLDGAACGYWE